MKSTLEYGADLHTNRCSTLVHNKLVQKCIWNSAVPQVIDG